MHCAFYAGLVGHCYAVDYQFIYVCYNIIFKVLLVSKCRKTNEFSKEISS